MIGVTPFGELVVKTKGVTKGVTMFFLTETKTYSQKLLL